jgi:hypothetical protein
MCGCERPGAQPSSRAVDQIGRVHPATRDIREYAEVWDRREPWQRPQERLAIRSAESTAAAGCSIRMWYMWPVPTAGRNSCSTRRQALLSSVTCGTVPYTEAATTTLHWPAGGWDGQNTVSQLGRQPRAKALCWLQTSCCQAISQFIPFDTYYSCTS